MLSSAVLLGTGPQLCLCDCGVHFAQHAIAGACRGGEAHTCKSGSWGARACTSQEQTVIAVTPALPQLLWEAR